MAAEAHIETCKDNIGPWADLKKEAEEDAARLVPAREVLENLRKRRRRALAEAYVAGEDVQKAAKALDAQIAKAVRDLAVLETETEAAIAAQPLIESGLDRARARFNNALHARNRARLELKLAHLESVAGTLNFLCGKELSWPEGGAPLSAWAEALKAASFGVRVPEYYIGRHGLAHQVKPSDYNQDNFLSVTAPGAGEPFYFNGRDLFSQCTTTVVGAPVESQTYLGGWPKPAALNAQIEALKDEIAGVGRLSPAELRRQSC